VQQLQEQLKEFNERKQYWVSQKLDAELADLVLHQSSEPAEAFFRMALSESVPALQREDGAAAERVFLRMRAAYQRHRAAVEKSSSAPMRAPVPTRAMPCRFRSRANACYGWRSLSRWQ
jgi:hypothetical protein